MNSKYFSDVENFYFSILQSSIESLKLNFYKDNFDAGRFNYDGVDHSLDFDGRRSAYYFDWFFKNKSDLYNAYISFEDENSKSLFIELINFRLAGHLSVKINVPWRNDNQKYDDYKQIEKFTPSNLKINGMFGNLRHYDFIFNNNHYISDCQGFEFSLFRKQYYYDQNNISIKPEIGDIVIDGGACLGETTLIFSNTVGIEGAVYAFDLVDDHLKIIEHNLKFFKHKNVTIMPYGLSDRDVDAPPITLNKYDAGFKIDNKKVPLMRIDSLLDKGINHIDFIKLDIEGSEMECIVGSDNVINICRPKLAISIYHNIDDIFLIINYIKSKYNFYKFYLGHYTIHQEETILYCKPY